MRRSLASLELNDLDWEDRSFAIRRFTSNDLLDVSLSLHGLLSPPWVWARSKRGCIVVDGFHRLAWAREQGIERVECLVFPAESQRDELLLRRMEGKLFGPPLNVAEKAQVVAALANTVPKEYIHERFLSALQIPPRPGVLERWLRLAAADDALLAAAAREDVSQRTALELAEWKEGERGIAVGLLSELRCSASIQVELLERITEIAQRRGRPRSEILLCPEIRGIRDHTEWNHRRKTQVLRDLLYAWRFPRLRAREESFQRGLAAVELPKALRLTPPPAFEGEHWQLQISFSQIHELDALLEKARDVNRSPELRRLLQGCRKPSHRHIEDDVADFQQP